MIRLEQLSTYACYYGPDRLADLAAFDLVILQSGHYPAGEVQSLRRQNTLPIAYLSIGQEPTRQPPAGWELVDPETSQMAHNPTWQTDYVDCRSSAWQDYLLHHRVSEIVARNFAGLFLDTLDVADRFPETRPGVIHLIRRIRTYYPHLVLIANRGFSLLEEIVDLLDALLFEAFTTFPVASHYAVWDDDALAWTAQQATILHAIGRQLPVLALDYAAPTDYALHYLARQRARAHGLLPYVTTRALDWLPATDPVEAQLVYKR